MNFKSQRIGEHGERTAEKFLCQNGLKCLQRNYRCRLGEIDLIMQDDEHLVFVEVRQRKDARFGSALATVTVSKQRKLILAAQHFVMTHKISGRQALRFDVVGITSGSSEPVIDWIANAFQGQ